MARLHEILAVEPDAEGVAKKVIAEAEITFGKRAEHFMSSEKVLQMDDASSTEDGLTERKAMVTTVHDKLAYVAEQVSRYLNVVAEKEATNQYARAELVVDGISFGSFPATFLLGLEVKLKNLRLLYEAIPTLQPGIEWERDPSEGEFVYRTKHPEVKIRTAKTFMSKVLYQATDKHPAQIEKWEEQKPVGKYVVTTKSSMLSVAEKSAILGRLDRLIQAVKKARQQANMQEVVPQEGVGESLFKYINGR